MSGFLVSFNITKCYSAAGLVLGGAGLVAKLCPACDPMDCIARQAPLPMVFCRQEYWSGFPFPSPRDLPNPGIEPRSPALQADSLPSKSPGKPPQINYWLPIGQTQPESDSGTWEQDLELSAL